MSTKTGPQKYPLASTSHWYQDTYPGDAMEVNVIVWHSTEGTSLPDYSGGSVAPNFTAVPDFTAEKLTWYQHFDFDVSARALVHTGAVATNTLNVDQVEIVGTCDPTTHTKWTKSGIKHLYMPELPAWAIRDLAAFSKWAHANHGVPLTSTVTWKAYPASYGANGVRLSDAAWMKYSGHCGHQHVPSGNVHGDPGLFPMAAILTAASGGIPTENDMALTNADADLVATAVLKKDGVIANPVTGTTNDYITPATSLRNIEIIGRRSEVKLDALSTITTSLVNAVAQLSSGIDGIDPAAIVAELKAAIENVTIHLDSA